MGQNQIKNPRLCFLTHSSVWEVWKISGMTLTKFNACMAVDQLLQQSLDKDSGNGPTTSTLVGPKFFLFAVKILYVQNYGQTNNCLIEVFVK